MTPTQRSLKLLRDRGYMVAIVEKWNHYVKVRQDLFGIFDLLAIRGDETVGVQTTSGSNVAARIAKITESDSAKLWNKSPNRKIIVHGWRLAGERGKRKTWQCREELIP